MKGFEEAKPIQLPQVAVPSKTARELVPISGEEIMMYQELCDDLDDDDEDERSYCYGAEGYSMGRH